MFLILKTTLYQVFAIFGLFFVIGYILSKLQTATQKMYHTSIGWGGILWTAIIGTPVHELGHYVFCKLFRHRVLSISLYKPNQRTGNLGSVDHSYNKKSLYQKIGNFFIGAAPLIWGSLALVLLFRFVLPHSEVVLPTVRNLSLETPKTFLTDVRLIGQSIFSQENFYSVQFWVWLYISFAIAVHLAPSTEDQKTMWRGLFWIILLLILVNTIGYFFNHNITQYILRLKAYEGLFIFAFWYALVVSLVHAIVAFIMLLPIRFLRRLFL